jgi:RNA polymerase sigma factor (sigma-70 family)
MAPSEGLVLVVDDDASVRDSLQGLLRSTGLRCQTFGSPAEILACPPPRSAACLILDVQLPGRSGLDLPAELARAGLDMPIIFITGHGTIPMSVRAMKGGAVEFLTKPFSEAELLAAISQALERDELARAARAEQRALSERFAKLTPRERDVFLRVAAGRMNKEIAAELGIVEQTIKQHRGRVMQKLGVDSIADLVRFAERLDASS